MSAWSEVQRAIEALSPHLAAMALISLRLLPVALLCPLFGGASAPMHLKLGLVLALASFLHFSAGVSAPVVSTALELAALAVREVVFGLTLGVIASLPFDAARIGGRFIDLFRGSSAEAALPLSGTKEAATGDAFFHLLLALCASGVIMPLWVSSLLRSFGWVKLGAIAPSHSVTMQVVKLVGVAFATGLAIGAPIAGLCLAVDGLVGLVSRAAPSLNPQELGSPLRILGGGAVVWLLVGMIAERALAFAADLPDTLRPLLETGP